VFRIAYYEAPWSKKSLSLVRTLDRVPRLAGTLGGRLFASVCRACCCRRKTWALVAAFFRVTTFARQPQFAVPLLAAVGARTRTIEIGTAVIDMRYENPPYMAEDARRSRPDRRWPICSWASVAARLNR